MRTRHRAQGLQIPVIIRLGGLAILCAPLLCRAQGAITGVITTVASDGPSTSPARLTPAIRLVLHEVFGPLSPARLR